MEKLIPKKTETIAVIRKERLADKLKRQGRIFRFSQNWWNSPWIELTLIFLTAVLNFYLLYPFIQTQPSSIIYSGPLIPFMSRMFLLLGLRAGGAIQLTNILFFLALPHAYYRFIKLVTGRKWVAFLAMLLVMTPFFPFIHVRIDQGLLAKEGASMASLTMLPIALSGTLLFIRTGRIPNLLVAVLAGAAIALISLFGFFLFGICAVLTAFSEILLGHGRLKIVRLLTIFFFASTLTSFWYNPVFSWWLITSTIGTEIGVVAGKILPILIFSVPVLGAFGYLLFDRRPNLQPVFLACTYTFTFALVLLTGGAFVPSSPSRYMPIFGIAGAYLLSMVMVGVNNHFIKTRFMRSLGGYGESVIVNILPLAIALILIVTIIAGRALLLENEELIPSWTGSATINLWTVHNQFSGITSVVGIAISCVSAGMLTYLIILFRKQQQYE